MSRAQHSIPLETLHRRIYVIRNHNVMLDQDLAALYGVGTKVLNQAVSRNMGRFPDDFMFRLTHEEFATLKSQIVTSRWGGRRYSPYAFTEQGVAMLSTVLRSEQAIQVNVAIMRAFVRMREVMISHKDLAQRIDDMERKYDSQFKVVFDAIRRLMEPPVPSKKRSIGYIVHDEDV
jgi:hypothetical protein